MLNPRLTSFPCKFTNQLSKQSLRSVRLRTSPDALASDEGQRAHYQSILPILMNSHLGWYSWVFIAGHLFGVFTGIIYSNGYRRPAAAYLAEKLHAETSR